MDRSLLRSDGGLESGGNSGVGDIWVNIGYIVPQF